MMLTFYCAVPHSSDFVCLLTSRKVVKEHNNTPEIPLISLIESCNDLVISLVITLFPPHLSFDSDPK